MSLVTYFRATARKTPEVLPLVGFVSIVCSFGVYSVAKKVLSDRDLRIRQDQGQVEWQDRLAYLMGKQQ
ncbi:hypothetical protein GGF32_009873 [Allomyces javanicus]|nr:hypothetical protein GGF32_009873 [Allomyces javanicus]KAJ3369636.1 hypothetical protein GGF31_005153 [Allomyces arbusculus]